MSTTPTPTTSSAATHDLETGRRMIERGDAVAAAAFFQDLAARHPADAQVRLGWGVALMAAGQPSAAAPVLLKATRLDPTMLEARLALGNALVDTQRVATALDVLTQTAVDFAHAPEVWGLKGTIERRLNNPVAAERSFREQDRLAPNDAHTLNNLAVAVRAQGRTDEAIILYRRALELRPQFATVHGNLGNALDAAGLSIEAERHLQLAVEHDPQSVDHRYNLAAHWVREENSEAAIAPLRSVVAAKPERWDAWTNLGVALVAVGDFTEAERCYCTALALRPHTPEAHYNLAWLLLLLGRWREGWAEYEWRWQLPTFTSRRWQLSTPTWDGTPQPAHTILVIAEQGVGDAIQFVRFAHDLRTRCRHVIVMAPDPVAALLRCVEGISHVVAFDAPIPTHDTHVHMMSLPGLLSIEPHSVQTRPAYLRAPAARPEFSLGAAHRPRIGFVWAGSPDNKIDRRRSCDIRLFADLFKQFDIDLVSLQVGPRASELHKLSHSPSFDLAQHGASWLDTASVINQLDLVIGVDTAVIHLAGALGRPAWAILPFSPDFRWLLGRADTPWYESVRLFRQPRPAAWTEVFREVRGALTNWLQSRS